MGEWEATKTKHPNKGYTLNNGQRPMHQSVCYLETPLYTLCVSSSQVQEMSEEKYRDEKESMKVMLEQMKEILNKLSTKQ